MPDKNQNILQNAHAKGAASTASARRSRYARAASASSPPLLTPTKWRMLGFLAEMRFLSLPQLARLCCPANRRDLSEKSARRHLRSLFDAGLVDVLPVSRAALAPPDAKNDASLLYGSAPNVYAPTKEGLRLLLRAGRIGGEEARHPLPAYGPKNGLFLAHELLVRDVRVWLEACARESGYAVERWEDGEAAAIPLDEQNVTRSVRPDAWFVYRMGKIVLVGLVEVDRGTERGDRRWQEKLADYAALFAGDALRAETGYVNARVLVVCPDRHRRGGLADLVARHTDPALAGRFWLAERAILETAAMTSRAWLRGVPGPMQSLILPG